MSYTLAGHNDVFLISHGLLLKTNDRFANTLLFVYETAGTILSDPDNILDSEIVTSGLADTSLSGMIKNRNQMSRFFSDPTKQIPLVNKYVLSYISSCHNNYSGIFNKAEKAMSASNMRAFFTLKTRNIMGLNKQKLESKYKCTIIDGKDNYDVCADKLVNLATKQQGLSLNCNELPKYCNQFGIGSSGCFTPDQQVKLPSGFMPIGEAKENAEQEIMTLTPNSTFEAPSLKASTIEYFTSDEQAYEQPLFTIKTAGGVTLKVTKGHPLLDAEGRIKFSDDFKLGEALIRADGSLDFIIGIVGETMVYRAFNVAVKSDKLLEQIIVAGDNGGILSGSHYYQVHEIDRLKRILSRINVPESLVARGRR